MTRLGGVTPAGGETERRVWDATAAVRRLRRVSHRKHGDRRQRVSMLVGLASQAAELVQARAYARDTGDLRDCLVLLREVPTLLGTMLDSAPDDEDDAFERSLALRLGRALAQGLHAALHRAWREGQRATPAAAPQPRATSRMVSRAEWTYQRQLSSSRSACRAQRAARLQALLEEVVSGGFDRLVPLTRHVASLTPQDRDHGAFGLRVSQVGRKTAFLAAALVLLRSRLSSRRTFNTTAEIAASRAKLSRREPRLRPAPRALRAAPSDRVRLCGRIEAVEWSAQPTSPYTRLGLQGTETNIYARHKNLQRLGIQAGMAVWAAGKVETVNGAPALVVEFEGPGQHAGQYWEDWLATEVRSAYDLYPEVLFMEWEYPPAGGTHVSADVRARLRRRRKEA